jgi:coenzyme F420-reducing hydrogenase delta subunit
MSDANKTKIITLICERSVDLNQQLDDKGCLIADPHVQIVKFPCSGMIQPLMIEAALKAGASGVIVCGCQIGDCYYREGNRMIRERLLGDRPPGLKKTVDRRRVIGLWLSRPQTGRFISEAREFVSFVNSLPVEVKAEPAKPAPAAKLDTASKAEPPKKEAPKSEGESAKKTDELPKSEPETRASEPAAEEKQGS